jgi:6-phosphogluconolactonase
MRRPRVIAGDDVAERFAATFVSAARAAVSARWAVTVALSGGGTPRPFLVRLAEGGLAASIEWRVVHAYQVDERPVPPDHGDSNYRMLAECLLSRVPIPPDQVHRMRGEADDLAAAAADYDAGLPSELDLVLLGLGEDGHTASLFPGSPALAETSRRVVANPVAKLGATRLTLTYPALFAARDVWFIVTGAAKAGLVRDILAGEADVPAARLAEHPRVTWFLDAAAASAVPASALCEGDD